MPYRRLPNTDKARLRAIEAALNQGKILAPSQLAFSYLSLMELQSVYPLLSGANLQLNRAKETQFSNSKEYNELYRRAKLYVSHFIQVLNFAIAREDVPSKVRAFYGLKVDQERMPTLTKEEHIFKWGRKLIDGEAERLAQGGTAFYNPSVALVRVHYEKFEAAYIHRKGLQKLTGRASKQMQEVRERADDIILKVWNEVEETFANLSEEEKRNRACEYGICYVYRPVERKRMEAERLQTKLNF